MKIKNLFFLQNAIFFVILDTMDRNAEDEITITQETIRELCNIVNSANDEQFIYDFFECLFTKSELKDIANRWLLVKEIDKGTPQREIAKKFGMSLCKITRGSKELNKPDSVFRKILDKNQNHKE